MKTKWLLTLPLFITLTGCGTLNSDFSCNAESGVGCKSITDVNDMVNTGNITTNGGVDNTTPLDEGSTLPRTVVQQFDGSYLASGVRPERVAEIAMPIWVAPYTDDEDNFHSGEMVYTVIKEAQWEY